MTEQTPLPPPPKDPDVEMLTKNKSLYDVGAGQVLWKNFLAGFGRALGLVAVYLVFVAISGILFARFALPFLSPLINLYSSSLNSAGSYGRPGTTPTTGAAKLPQ